MSLPERVDFKGERIVEMALSTHYPDVINQARLF